MTFQETESGRHRQTRGSEKTGQSGRCGRAGTRPLRLEQLVQGENETRKAAVCALDGNEAGGLRGEAPFTGAILVLGCESMYYP